MHHHINQNVGRNNVLETNIQTIDKAVKKKEDRTSYANVVRGKGSKDVRDRIGSTSGMWQPMNCAHDKRGSDEDRKIVFDRLR